MALLAGACAAPPFDLDALERRHPALAAVPAHRLADVTPYALPRHGELLWFLCRWDAPRVRVALPAASELAPGRRELLLRALAAWSAAGLGIAIDPVEAAAGADVVIAVVASEDGRAGRTRAECGVVVRGDGLAARLVHARVVLMSGQLDVLGREVALSDAEWLGSAVHEIGHALGFQGHARRGPMVRNVEEVRRIGRHLLEGRPLDAPTLRALYAVPSGTLLARVPLAPDRTRALDRLARTALERGYRGPIVRVGDRAARIAWWDAQGQSVGVRIPDIRAVLRDASHLEIEPDLLARAWLGPGS